MHLGGRQRITTSHGHIIPLDFENGLPYIKMQLPSDDDRVNYPHVIMTRDVPWDPKRYDLKQSDNNNLFAALAAEDGHIPLHDGFNYTQLRRTSVKPLCCDVSCLSKAA